MLSEGSIGRAGGHAEDVVALQALKEGSKAAAENGLAVSEEIFGEADARLKRLVVVGDHAPRVTVYAGKVGAVDVRRGYPGRYTESGW